MIDKYCIQTKPVLCHCRHWACYAEEHNTHRVVVWEGKDNEFMKLVVGILDHRGLEPYVIRYDELYGEYAEFTPDMTLSNVCDL